MTDSAMKPVRRIVTIDDAEGQSLAIADGPSPDRTTDPARPGFVSERIWVTDSSPPQIDAYRDAVLHHPRAARTAARRLGVPHRHLSAR